MNVQKENNYAVLIGEVVVNKCLVGGIAINTSKLMKLLYFMQRKHLQKYDELMFSDEIIVTGDGPRIESVANYFMQARLGFSTRVEQRIVLMDSHEEIVDEVLDIYGKYSPNQLIKLSKEDDIYKMFWQNGKGNNRVIPFHSNTQLETKSDKTYYKKYTKN